MRGKDHSLDSVKGIRLPVGSDTQVCSSGVKQFFRRDTPTFWIIPFCPVVRPQRHLAPHPILLKSPPTWALSVAHGAILGACPAGPVAAFGGCGTLTSGTSGFLVSFSHP